MSKATVAIIMGSDSDLPVMNDAVLFLEEMGIATETSIVSAHRTPQRMLSYAQKAHTKGIKVIIAGAGGAAHLPGMVAAISPLPVIGVPIKSSNSIDGLDSLFSIVQMPGGVPVATVAVNGAKNAGILALQILATHNPTLHKKVIAYKEGLRKTVEEKAANLEKHGPKKYLAGKKK